MKWLDTPYQHPDEAFLALAEQRQAQLTKPPRALGQLEVLAIRLAGLQRREKPAVDKVHISVFAADHGVAVEGVSAFPQAVTAQMVQNFLHGGAAVNVLARALDAHLEVVDVGVKSEISHPDLISQRAGAGTKNSAEGEAMTAAQLAVALQAGFDSVERALAQHADVFIGGEMGIANTTSATAIYCALLDLPPVEVVGPGTGLDKAGMLHKVGVVQHILNLHRDSAAQPLELLRRVGGFEIAALTGAYLHAAQRGLPVLVDGFISTAAALLAVQLQPAVSDWLFLSHASAEPGHYFAVAALQHVPILDLEMRLGEGSGAAVAVPVLRMACALHNQMATFAGAAVAGKL